jgi:hypothetical protein
MKYFLLETKYLKSQNTSLVRILFKVELVTFAQIIRIYNKKLLI